MNNSESLKEEKQSMLEEWKNSGQSKSAYCKERGIAYHSFFYWQKKLGSSASPTPAKFLEFSPPGSSTSLAQTEIIYPNGKRIVFHYPVEVSILKQLTE